MIEINRSLYINERTGKKTENFKELKKFIFNLLKEIEELQKKTSCITMDQRDMPTLAENVYTIIKPIIYNKPLNKVNKQFVLENTTKMFAYHDEIFCRTPIKDFLENEKITICILETMKLLTEAFYRKQLSIDDLYKNFKEQFCRSTRDEEYIANVFNQIKQLFLICNSYEIENIKKYIINFYMK